MKHQITLLSTAKNPSSGQSVACIMLAVQ